MLPATCAPALRASSASSSSDARSASPASIPGTCEARFIPTPTRNTRSWLSVGRVVFILRQRRLKILGERDATMGTISRTQYTPYTPCRTERSSPSSFANPSTLFSPAQDSRQDRRAAATMKYGDHNTRAFIGCIRDENITYLLKAQFLRGLAWPKK